MFNKKQLTKAKPTRTLWSSFSQSQALLLQGELVGAVTSKGDTLELWSYEDEPHHDQDHGDDARSPTAGSFCPWMTWDFLALAVNFSAACSAFAS